MTSSASVTALSDEPSIQGVLLPFSAAAACILLIPPLTLHFRSRNLPICALLARLLITNAFSFINGMIWREGRQETWWDGQGLCDVEAKLYLALGQVTAGVPACVFRRLANVLIEDRPPLAIATRREKWSQIAFESFFCVIIPTYLMGVHYIVQSERYAIYPVTGCTWTFSHSWLAIVLILIWLPVTCLVGLAYGCITTIRLFRHRRQVSSILFRNASWSGTSRDQFNRLYILSSLLVLAYTPASLFVFLTNLEYSSTSDSLSSSNEGQFEGIAIPRYSWSHVHPPDWTELIDYHYGLDETVFNRWAQIGTALVCFLFFGLGKEVSQLYSGWWKSTRVGWLYRMLKRQLQKCRSSEKEERTPIREDTGDDKSTFMNIDNLPRPQPVRTNEYSRR